METILVVLYFMTLPSILGTLFISPFIHTTYVCVNELQDKQIV